MFDALVRRDASYDGLFFACVRTTGIFCRPVCRARKPKPQNVEFVSTAAAALHAGYRPCKVCRPLDRDPDRPSWAARLIRSVGSAPNRRIRDRELIEEGLNPATVRRYFVRHFGVTFQAFQRAWRLGIAMRALSRGAGISAAGVDAGYESESGFRDAFAKVFGMPPGASRSKEALTAAWISSPLGPMIAIASEHGLVLLEFVDRRALERELQQVRTRFRRSVVPGSNEHLAQVERELAAYFAGRLTAFDVALDTRPTPFQQAVWTHLRTIPYGATQSYGEVAEHVGRPGASRAVGSANGQNRIAIVIPCHRVVRSDGSLSGYGGGVWRKQRLLELERAALSNSPVSGRPSRPRATV